MRITEILKKDSISLGENKASKRDIVEKLTNLMEKSGNVSDKSKFIEDVLKRENMGSTGLGNGVAIPHAKSKGITRPGLAAMTVPEGTDYESLDGEDTKLFFNIAVPDNSNDEHLVVLSRLSTMLMDKKFISDLLNAKNKDEFLEIIDKKEKEKFPIEDNTIPIKNKDNNYYDIVAVTGCPTGIAHTYMAEEAIIEKAKEMGLRAKVETHGTRGVENVLSSDEIKNAKGVIIAADINIEKDRFDGKKLVSSKVSDGINKPEKLIKQVLNEASIYKAKSHVINETKEDNDKSFLSSTYKHLMYGVSHMLPFVIGGGILIAIAFLLDDYTIDPSSFGSNTPIAATFNQIGGAAFGFMLPILAGFIGMSIADRPGFTAGMVGGFLANQGGAGFLGALVAGFVAGYLIILIRKATSFLPKSMDGVRSILLYPVLGILGIGLIMLLLLNPPFAALNTVITNWLNSMGSASKLVLGFILGGMMAVDMGGPINKAAYVFGTASLASGASEVMAAVMVGGMVPPLALALSMLLFKNKYTEKDRQTIPTNIIMGLSFITEGAIPFAAADPLRVLPSMVLGSGLAGMLSMIFGSALRAPHGGLWVIGVISNPLGYIVALLTGTIVSAVVYGFLKKRV